MNKSIIYARVSSKEQEKEGYSIPAQLKLLYTYAEKHNYIIAKEFVDIETAKESGRTNFSEMITFLEINKDVKILLCEKTDRLYRNFKDYVIIDDLDLTLVFVKEGSVLNKYSRSHDKFIHGIKVLMAKNYIDNLSEETRKGMNEKAGGGEYPSLAPLGYRNNKEGKCIEIDEERAPFVREIFELYASGDHSLREIETLMFRKGFRTRSGNRVSRSHVDLLLKNPFYYGDFKWSGKLWSGNHPPLISKDLFNRVQSVIHRYKNTRSKNRGFVYTNLLLCGVCGSSITAEIKKERYIYYHCTFNRGKCSGGYIREENLENEFKKIFKKLRFNPQIIEWIKEGLRLSLKEKNRFHQMELGKLNDEYLKLENRVNRIYIDKLDGEVSEDFYRSSVDGWRNEQEEILKAIKGHQSASEHYLNEGIKLLELANNSYKYFTTQNKIEKALLIKTIFEVSILENEKITPTFRPPFDIIYGMSEESRKSIEEYTNTTEASAEGAFIDASSMKKAGKIPAPIMSVMLPLLDNFRTFCYNNTIEELPACFNQ